jgi:hypothetical protein
MLGLLLFAAPAVAQGTSALSVSAGYSLRMFTEPGNTRDDLNGFYVSANYDLFKRFGAEAEVSDGYVDRGTNGNLSILSGMIGPRFYPLGHHKITLFAHVLGGEGYYRVKYPAFSGFPATLNTYLAPTWEAGGGIEYKHSNRWSVRIIEGDFGQTRFFTGAGSQTNIRVSAGVIYHFGQK